MPIGKMTPIDEMRLTAQGLPCYIAFRSDELSFLRRIKSRLYSLTFRITRPIAHLPTPFDKAPQCIADRFVRHYKGRLVTRTLLLVAFILLFSPGCTSTLKAVAGTYSYYEVIEGKVTYFRWNPMAMQYHRRILEEADPHTFEAVGTEHGKDATTVYEWDIPILHADPATFKRLSENYAKDATQVFYGRTRLEGADLATFERLGDGWSRDADDVYFGSERLNVCDIATFEPLSMWRALDSRCYYIQAERLADVDRASLEILVGAYAKDQSYVYWLEHIVDGADPATFDVKDDQMHSLARDATQCFSGVRVVVCDELNAKGQAYCRC